MTSHIRPALALALVTSAIVLAACGGQGGSPTAPSSGDPASSNTSVVISGTVRTGSALLSSGTGASMAGLTVTVVGTTISAQVDGANRFTLTGVPPGDVQLRFSGGGVESTVTLTSLQASQTVTIVVNVSGAAVSVEAEQRSGRAEQELEGRVESLPPTMPAGAVRVAGRTVLTNTSTRVVQGGSARAFGDLQIGMRVHVKGSASGADLLASEIRIQNTNTWLPVNVNGVIDSFIAGAVFQFKIGSRLIKGDDLTRWSGTGNTTGSPSMLADGVRVEVKGQQRDGYIYAERIHVNGSGKDDDDDDDDDDKDDDEQDSSASIHGTLTAIGGSKPALSLTVGGTAVRTTSGTRVKRRGDDQTLDQLKVGQSLHVVGTRQPDGSLVARKIEIDDDAAGGEFEIEGSAGSVQGTCPAVTFSVNGFTISTTAATTFDGTACSALRSGSKVSVKGTKQADGSVRATRIRVR